jgi:hypothetical protein
MTAWLVWKRNARDEGVPQLYYDRLPDSVRSPKRGVDHDVLKIYEIPDDVKPLIKAEANSAVRGALDALARRFPCPEEKKHD